MRRDCLMANATFGFSALSTLARVVPVCVAFALLPVSGAVLTPDMIGPPFAVQPFAGLIVTGGQTEPFFSDLSGLSFSQPTIVTVLVNIRAVDSGGSPIPGFHVTGVTVTQGASLLTPPLEMFLTPSPVTYASTLNPSTQVTIHPGETNLGFVFNSDPSFQYSYTLSVTGVPDGGLVVFNDVEGAIVPEPDSVVLVSLPLVLAGLVRHGPKIRSRALRTISHRC